MTGGALRAVAACGAALAVLPCATATAQTLTPIIRTTPALSPAFNPAVPDYVSRCVTGTNASGSVSVFVRARGNSVSVDGAAAQTGIFDDQVTLSPGQGFKITVGTGDGASTYTVRCLPADFPPYSSTVSGSPQVSFVLAAPYKIGSSADRSSSYVAMFDSDGVPVWWDHVNGRAMDADLDPNGDLSWSLIGAGDFPYFGVPGSVSVQVANLDGTILNTLGTNGTPTDFHEAWPLANGDFLIDSYVPELNVPVSIPGEPATVNVLDGSFQEVDPSGSTLYSWTSAGHINPDDSSDYEGALSTYPGVTEKLWDWNHINAVQPYENGYLVSFRNTGAVYYIDGTTGDVIWKLGGTYDQGESLTILGDPLSATDFASQHDVRAWPDGTVSVFDNGTHDLQQPRVLRFSIDAANGTATLIQSITLASAPFSLFMGSARAVEPSSMATSDWVIAWGGTPYVTEQSPTGQAVLTINLGHSWTTYRAVPLSSSQLSIGQIETAMDTIYGTPAAPAGRPRTARG